VSSAATAILVGFIGLVGVIAGSVLSGWVQTRQAEKHRELLAQVAARVVYADIELAWQQLDDQRKHKLNVPHDPDIRRYLVSWAEHRDAFAAGVAFRDYHTVAAGFASLDSYLYYLATNPAPVDQLILLAAIESLERARPVAWVAGGGSASDFVPRSEPKAGRSD
jgi:type II secretory pathway pseudopilin PulG